MKLSVVIPYCYGGDELREIALDNLMLSIKAQDTTDFELIVVEQFVKNDMVMFRHRDKVDQFITLIDPEKRTYNKSWGMNVGVRVAKSDNVLVLDADIMFGKDYFSKIIEFSTNKRFFHGYNWLTLMPGRDNPIVRIWAHSKICATGGAWFTTKDFYWNKVGGMNENYFGYGGEDNDMERRVKYLLKTIPEIDYPLIHQYHHWHPVTGGNPLSDFHKLLDVTERNPLLTITRLQQVQLGNISNPTLIEMC